MARPDQLARTARPASRWRRQLPDIEESIEVQRGTKYIFGVEYVQYIVPRWFYMSLWVAAIVLQAGLATIMFRRGLVRRFPAFFVYTVYVVLLNSFLFTIDHIDAVSGDDYMTAFIAGAAGTAALRFALACEIFVQVFQSYSRLKGLGSVVFQWATAILMIVAVLVVAYTTGLQKDQYTIAFLIVDRGINLIQCGLLVFLVLLATFLRFSWTSYTMGIALGFGIFSSSELCRMTLQSQYGKNFAWKVFPVTTMVTYIGCIGIWIATVLLPEYRSRRIRPGPVKDLQNWSDTLERLLRQ